MAASTYDNVSPSNRRLKEEAEKRRTEYNERRSNDRVSSGNRGPIERDDQRQNIQVETTQEVNFETSEPEQKRPNPGRYNNAIGERLRAKNKIALREQSQARKFQQRQERLGKLERGQNGELKEALDNAHTEKGRPVPDNKETNEETTETTTETTQPAVEAQPEPTEEPAAVEAENQVEAKTRAKAYKDAANDDEMKSAFGK